MTIKGTLQKLLSGFCPLRGGEPPFPLSFFEHNDCLLRGGGVPPNSAYLIFVIFFTQAKFLENKIYTKKRQLFALNL